MAIITILDHTAATDAGAIVGQQRIDGPTALPIAFSVLVDDSAIDQTHAYGLYATIVDGASTWQNPTGEPVITGGPTSGIALSLTALPATAPAKIDGTIAPPAGTRFGPAAVTLAALIKLETGTLVARQVRPLTNPADLAFSIGYDPALIDPSATYVVKGGIIDGASMWQNRAGVTVIQGGKATSSISLPVAAVDTLLPVASPFPTPIPSQTPSPSTAPSAAPSAAPSGAPSAAPSGSSAPDEPLRPLPRPRRRPPRRRRRPRRRRPDASSDAGTDGDACSDTQSHAGPDVAAVRDPVHRGVPDADPRLGQRHAHVSRAVPADRGRVCRRRARARIPAGDRELHRRVVDRPRRERRPGRVRPRPR